MVLPKEKIEAFKEVTKPVIQWLNDNGYPHNLVIIDSTRAELMEGVCSCVTEEYLKD